MIVGYFLLINNELLKNGIYKEELFYRYYLKS